MDDRIAAHDLGQVTRMFDSIDAKATSRYVLDLSDVEAIDPSALGFFLLFNGEAQRRGKSVALVTGGTSLRDSLERLRIDTLILVVDRLEEAGVMPPASLPDDFGAAVAPV